MLSADTRQRIPDFIVVGAAKSGTTALYRYLSADSRVFIPNIKECRFFSQMPRNFRGGPAAKFANGGPRQWNDYVALYAGNEHKLRGDISNDYFFYYQKSIRNIMRFVGQDVKIIIVLRNPVDRIFSQYLHAVRLGSERYSFEDALALEDKRADNNFVWSMLYQRTGMSAEATQAFMGTFQNTLVLLYEDVFGGNGISRLSDFLGLDNFRADMTEKVNASQPSLPRSWLLGSLLNRLRVQLGEAQWIKGMPSPIKSAAKRALTRVASENEGRPAVLPAKLREKLCEGFSPDIQRLEVLVERDLSHWLQLDDSI